MVGVLGITEVATGAVLRAFEPHIGFGEEGQYIAFESQCCAARFEGIAFGSARFNPGADQIHSVQIAVVFAEFNFNAVV